MTYQGTTAPFLLRRASPERAYEETPFTVQNGSVTLRGSVLMPRTAGRHSAILFHHGAYQDDRNAFRFWADQLARHGVATVIYDNRGAGESTGEPRTSFDSLASDTRAILDAVKRMPGIDAAHLGLFSGSQGGWVSALAAATNPDVRFVVMLAGPGLSVAKNVQWESESGLRAGGFSDSVVRVALSVKWQIDSMAAAGAPWDAIDNMRRGVAYQPWFGAVGLPDRTNWFWAWWKQVGSFDPAPFWQRFHGAVLDIQGTADTQVPWMKSRDALVGALNANPAADATVLIVPGMTHGMFAPYGSPVHVRAHLPPGLIDYVVHWLDQRVPGVSDVHPWGEGPWTEFGSTTSRVRR
jgi:pimeloyl-ACP methyl ester carboxylesterase